MLGRCRWSKNTIGCFYDTRARILPKQLANDRRNTPVRCEIRCRRAGYRYSGVQHRVQCFCGNLEPWGAFRRPNRECGTPCPGNKKLKKCGGTWRMTVSNVRRRSEKNNQFPARKMNEKEMTMIRTS